MTAVHKLLQLSSLRRGQGTYGAHALALTPDRKIILVKLRYARGWRVPGGGRSQEEDPVAAALRELREEIGMTSHGQTRVAGPDDNSTGLGHDRSTLLVVEDVRFTPRKWSLEVEQVRAFDPNELPAGTRPLSRRWIALLNPEE